MRLGQQKAYDLLKRAGGDRFALYDLENRAGVPVYVHAKICVVDDEWMTCRLRQPQSPLMDPRLRAHLRRGRPEWPTASNLRVSLWAEHLGLPPDDPRLLDLDGASELWARRAQEPDCRARPHAGPRVPRRTRIWAEPAYRLFVDPDGRPRALRRASASEPYAQFWHDMSCAVKGRIRALCAIRGGKPQVCPCVSAIKSRQPTCCETARTPSPGLRAGLVSRNVDRAHLDASYATWQGGVEEVLAVPGHRMLRRPST